MGIHYIEDTKLQKAVDAIKDKNGIETFNGSDLAKEIRKQPIMVRFISGTIDSSSKLYELTEEDLEGLTNIQSYGFYGMKWLKKVTIPETVTGMNNNVFNSCLNLEEIHLSSSIKSTGTAGFSDCSKLKKINVENFTAVADRGFQNCTEIEKLDFRILLQISGGAFSGCSKLSTLILRRAKVCTLSNISAFTNTPIANGEGFVYVPSAYLEAYKVATNWTTYSAQFRAIEDYPEICGGVSE